MTPSFHCFSPRPPASLSPTDSRLRRESRAAGAGEPTGGHPACPPQRSRVLPLERNDGRRPAPLAEVRRAAVSLTNKGLAMMRRFGSWRIA